MGKRHGSLQFWSPARPVALQVHGKGEGGVVMMRCVVWCGCCCYANCNNAEAAVVDMRCNRCIMAGTVGANKQSALPLSMPAAHQRLVVVTCLLRTVSAVLHPCPVALTELTAQHLSQVLAEHTHSFRCLLCLLPPAVRCTRHLFGHLLVYTSLWQAGAGHVGWGWL